MVTLTLSEATLNAVRAALDERVKRLEAEIDRLNGVHALWRDLPTSGPWPEAYERALVWNIAALHETKTAVEDFAEANCIPEGQDSVTLAKGYAEWTEAELRVAAGDR